MTPNPPKPNNLSASIPHRIQRKRVLAGVCAGFANYLHLPVHFVRLLFIALTLLAGFGLLLYLTLWLTLPSRQ